MAKVNNVKRFEELSVYELYKILKLRSDVFILEQQCLYPDIDGNDPSAYHVFITEDDEIIAYCRILPPHVTMDHVTIGRVVSKYRGYHLGEQVMKLAMDVIPRYFDDDAITLEAQCYAEGFYEKLGFQRISDEFLEDGIPHIQMQYKIRKDHEYESIK